MEVLHNDTTLTPCHEVSANVCLLANYELVGDTDGIELEVWSAPDPYGVWQSGYGCTITMVDPNVVVDGTITLRATVKPDYQWECQSCSFLTSCEAEVAITVVGGKRRGPPSGPPPTCRSCSGGLGDAEGKNNSIDVHFPLGPSTFGDSIGEVVYKVAQSTPDHPRPEVVKVVCSSEADNIPNLGIPQVTYEHQVKVPAGLVWIQDYDLNTPGFIIDFFTNETAGIKDGGRYDPVLEPFKTWYFNRLPDGTCQITESNQPGRGRAFNYTYSPNPPAKGWTMVELNDTAIVRSLIRTDDGATDRTETYEVRGPDDTVAYHEETEYEHRNGLEVPVETRLTVGSEIQATSKTYYASGRLRSVQHPDGSWVFYDYDMKGRKWHEIRPWLDVGLDDIDAPDYSLARTITYDYTSHVPCAPGQASSCDPGGTRPRTVTETVRDTVVSRTYHAYWTTAVFNELVHVQKRDPNPGDSYGYDYPGNIVSTEWRHPLGFGSSSPSDSGKLDRVLGPDLVLQTHVYERGAYQFDSQPDTQGVAGTFGGSGSATRVSIIGGTESSPAGLSGKTLKRVTVHDARGNLRLEQTFVRTEAGYSSGPVEQKVHDYDEGGRRVRATSLDGTYSVQHWTCCNKDWETDRTGIKHLFAYDSLGQLDTTTKEATPYNLVIQHLYDQLGRPQGETRSSTDPATDSLGWGRVLDPAGRALSESDEANRITNYEYSATTAGGRLVKTARMGHTLTEPTEVREYFLDGRLKHVYGRGVVEKTYGYGVNADGTCWAAVYTGPHNPPTVPSLRWEKTVTDCLGRTFQEVRPPFNDGTNPGNLITEYEYYTDNAAGHGIGRLKAVKPALGLAHTVYEYDVLGNVVVTGKDVNNDGLDPASSDRIQKTSSEYRLDGGVWWTITTNKTCPYDASAVEVNTSEDWSQLTGMAPSYCNVRRHVEFYNDGTGEYSKVTTSWSEIDRSLKRVINWTGYPDSTGLGQQLVHNGLLQASIDKTGTGAIYHYNSLEQRTGDVRPNTGENITVYNSQSDLFPGFVKSVEDPDGRKTEYYYDSPTARLTAITNPLGKTQRIAYTDRDEVSQVWGNAAYPVEYEYNAYGERTQMRTYRGPDTPADYWTGLLWPTNPTGAQETAWSYDPATGVLVSKTDAANRSVLYSYKADGRPRTRTWARGVVTTYSYYDTGALRTGDLMQVAYSNDSQATVEHTYTRNGQPHTASDAYGLGQTYTYAPTSQLKTETDGISTLTRDYGTSGNDVGRLSGITVTILDVPTYTVNYAYNQVAQLRQVTGPGLPPEGVTYGYANQSSAPDRLDFGNPQSPRAWTDHTYEYEAPQNPTARELIRSVQNGYRP